VADKFAGHILAGSIDVSIPVVIRSTGHVEQTGINAAAITAASYWRQGGSRVAITPSDLTAITDAHTDGGWFPVDATNMPGCYRFDIPDAAVASGADWVVIAVDAGANIIVYERFDLATKHAPSLGTDITAIKANTDNLPSAVKKNTALSNFKFLMVSNADHITPATGKTVTAQRAIDAGAFGACTNSVVEVTNGAYRINLSAADLNGDDIMLRFSAAGCDDRFVNIITKP
jgi:hypothetical protein